MSSISAQARTTSRLFGSYLSRLPASRSGSLWRALSTAGIVQEQQRGRGMCTTTTATGSTDSPRVLITGGMGQLGSGLAKVLRYASLLHKCGNLIRYFVVKDFIFLQA